jgi:hypothetical protein
LLVLFGHDERSENLVKFVVDGGNLRNLWLDAV